MFKVGEALIGEEPELAHIDLVIGDKSGPAGQAFLNGLTNLSEGHTPLLGVIKPNLPAKPSTLIVPKVTIRDMNDTEKIFGPAQEAVSKAVADSLEEGIIGEEEAEDIVIIASVFIHPEASDFQKIYRYNYGATKLAIKRALDGFPEPSKVIEEKDRGGHPIMGNRITRLSSPPYLQVALDTTDFNHVEKILREVPENDHVIFEVGTPLVKKYGVDVVSRMREIREDAFIVVDLKTLDTGNLEARMVADAGGDGVVVAGIASKPTIEGVIEEADKTGIYSIIDTINMEHPLQMVKELDKKPDIVELHRAIDLEDEAEHAWGDIPGIKKELDSGLVSVAGGLKSQNVSQAIKSGADILVVGRAITGAKDPEGAAREIIDEMQTTEVDQFEIKTDL
ncbi:bifunctional 5,6,7,8-tetrahydromethanopterin hydro-lyase/3-hexulose-6-phosphate synthase [Methanonatronarchaeum sp. AMET6-2]|uniref:bifunctional 5,6,7,8-tetrahydromethanopterin hydro-lyase/3-hexulose-6-phosphate synthase n=1 Tax=Methanonatronarchaeum sp. AMET6-2 TaxID=2933293 RepID=UPI0012227333|nr:bifunctional 5,6,7,8-tetrahydromethanopterin hydro-lyase/3-hexulose-6-phosphate synthase [Methanonatronarchaeum sp. AMET6-2]RZN62264.1 MAG: bifunctional 5,6,7,8-tetrahydromethanopterin hydro-lyase/3-hexulose-6-phosphate synthase [Methanonatronarchaeia archaeon]UOY10398.1 bifunctional 5,6,7,8-tetrahydromethanopterin hydro-lyase/3-hexulose-6-phosphate synthase [Methanonatronarchaeum sp. AMET6-2]